MTTVPVEAYKTEVLDPERHYQMAATARQNMIRKS